MTEIMDGAGNVIRSAEGTFEIEISFSDMDGFLQDFINNNIFHPVQAWPLFDLTLHNVQINQMEASLENGPLRLKLRGRLWQWQEPALSGRESK